MRDGEDIAGESDGCDGTVRSREDDVFECFGGEGDGMRDERFGSDKWEDRVHPFL